MAYIQTRQISLGQLLSGMFDELARIKRELAIYFGLFFVAGLVEGLFGFLSGIVAIAAFAGYFIGQFWLYSAALGKGGIGGDDTAGVFKLFLMAVMLVFPIAIGLNFFLIPGLLLAAKWVMAPAFLVAERRGVLEATGDSWRASANNTASLTLAFAVTCLMWFAGIIALGAVSAGFTALVPAIGSGSHIDPFQWLGVHILPVLLLGLSVSAYRALGSDRDSIAAVFE